MSRYSLNIECEAGLHFPGSRCLHPAPQRAAQERIPFDRPTDTSQAVPRMFQGHLGLSPTISSGLRVLPDVTWGREFQRIATPLPKGDWLLVNSLWPKKNNFIYTVVCFILEAMKQWKCVFCWDSQSSSRAFCSMAGAYQFPITSEVLPPARWLSRQPANTLK